VSDEIPNFGSRRTGINYRPRPSAYAVILDADGRVAFVREKEWLLLPGGGARAGETPRQTVEREVREECGRAITLHRELGSAVQLFEIRGEGLELHATFFAASFAGPVASPPEHELVWSEPGAVPSEVYHECHRWAVHQALPGTVG
jgi:8-oxo-dGTP pyrophosphatase MutT (NUDIX family)